MASELGDLHGPMARCYAYLESQGIRPLELSAMAEEDASDIAKQLAFEMSLPFQISNLSG